MSQYSEMRKEERAIANLINNHTKEELVEMTRRIARTRSEMFHELEELKNRQSLIDKALGALYMQERADTVEFD